MKRNKLIAFLLATFIILSVLPVGLMAAGAPNTGDLLGYTVRTDNKVTIDGHAIPAYCIDNQMLIKLDNLLYYGFDVFYDNVAKTLKAYRNVGKDFAPVTVVGATAKPYTYTDVKTYVNGMEIDRVMIDGDLYIYVDSLGYYGAFTWDGTTGTLNLALSDLSDKTPAKYSFSKAVLSTDSTDTTTYLTGFSVDFSGKCNYINPDDFTDLTVTKNGVPVEGAALRYDVSQWSYTNQVTTAVFVLDQTITEPGYYAISGIYKDLPFVTDKIVIDNATLSSTPANPDNLSRVVLGEKTISNSSVKALSNEITFYFDGWQGQFNPDVLSGLKLTLDGKALSLSLTNDVKRVLTYSEETDTFTTTYTLTFEGVDFAFGRYALSGKYSGKAFKTADVAVLTKSNKIPASVVFHADSSGILTRDNVVSQLSANGLTIYNDFTANFDASVTKIEKWAFTNVIGLTALHYSATIKDMGSIIFDGCDRLQVITADHANPYYTVLDNVLFSADMQMLVLFPSAGEGDYVIPESVQVIRAGAFYNCSGLTSVVIPNAVYNIDGHSFNACTGLQTVTIPENVKFIGFGAFAGCDNLASITFKGTTPPMIYDNVFPQIPIVYVPRASQMRYETALNLKIPGAAIIPFD